MIPAIWTRQSKLARLHLKSLPLDSVDRARVLANLGVCFENRFNETASEQACAKAMGVF